MPKRASKVLTAKAVASAKPPKAGHVEIPDGLVGGLVLRVSATGLKSWVLSGRPYGKLTRRALGRYPEMSLGEARRRAGALKDTPDLWGEDRGRQASGPMTFGDVATEYKVRECARLANGAIIAAQIDRELMPHWRNVPMATLRKRDAYVRTDTIVDVGKPAAAYALYETIRRIGRWATRRDMIDVNPFADMEPPVKKVARDRVLNPAEIKKLWETWDALAYPFGHLDKLLLATGQRLREVAGMRWSEIDREAALWTIPGARTKNGSDAEVPLSSLALEVLDGIPRFSDLDLVFSTSNTRRDRPISGFSRSKTALDRLSGVTNWRRHDLRRTLRTGLAELAVPEVVAEKVLNHAERNVLAKTYNRHEYATEKREALELWARRVREIVNPTPPGNVVPIRATGGAT